MRKVAFYTLGCKVNQYETEAMSELFKNKDYKIVDFEEYADIYIINTCSVTSMSDRKSRQIIRRAKKHNENAIVIVTGCYAQTAADEVLKIDGVNAVIGNQNKCNIVEICRSLSPTSSYNAVFDIMNSHEFENLTINNYESRTRAFIKIQDGCNQFCSYCIIPYARGPIRSRDEESILDEIKKLARNGFREVILTGIHVASYGFDTNTNLASLVLKIDGIDGIDRIRLSSIEPMAIDHTFIEMVKSSKKLCRHFHLSLQSGCDETLHRMNRKYTTAEFMDIVNGIRDIFPDAAITTDIMVGFPGETDEEFEKSLAFVNKVQFGDAHIFQYSPRRGTPAAKKKQIPPAIKEHRSKLMISATDKTRADFIRQFEGQTMDVLFERGNDGVYEGKTNNYIPVFVKSDTDISNKLLDVKMVEAKSSYLSGEIVK
ncbi:MAG: tRNA (N(6)-L-threonylcarbamoyladenosine(37)-C(2))-methylthiotransferase MtaB [Clostridia bacterium]|nr:tRNA (N(6)-L-threonylcarbamoyladenosine(37)-C(2))-methylthiotransferase MtaB [Clostridia bacterium]